jgi:hypothetical protein
MMSFVFWSLISLRTEEVVHKVVYSAIYMRFRQCRKALASTAVHLFCEFCIVVEL